MTQIPKPKYETVRRIGVGTFGTVFLVRNTTTDERFALKRIRCTNVMDANNALKEAFTMRGFSHPNIIKYIDAFFNGDEDGNVQVSLVMEYCPAGDMSPLIAYKGPRMQPTEFVRLFVQVAEALKFLHDNKLIHRDLKPSNILLSEGMQRAILTDFGLVREKEKDHLTTVTGTPAYMAPEQAKGWYNESADIWALGCIMMEAIAPPKAPYVIYMDCLTKGNREFKAENLRVMKKTGFPLELIELTNRCIDLEPEVRPTATSVYEELKAYVTREWADLPPTVLADTPKDVEGPPAVGELQRGGITSGVVPVPNQRIVGSPDSVSYQSFLSTMGVTRPDDDGLYHWIEGNCWFWFHEQLHSWFWSTDRKNWNNRVSNSPSSSGSNSQDVLAVLRYLELCKPTPSQLQEEWGRQQPAQPQHLCLPRQRVYSHSDVPPVGPTPFQQQLPPHQQALQQQHANRLHSLHDGPQRVRANSNEIASNMIPHASAPGPQQQHVGPVRRNSQRLSLGQLPHPLPTPLSSQQQQQLPMVAGGRLSNKSSGSSDGFGAPLLVHHADVPEGRMLHDLSNISAVMEEEELTPNYIHNLVPQPQQQPHVHHAPHPSLNISLPPSTPLPYLDRAGLVMGSPHTGPHSHHNHHPHHHEVPPSPHAPPSPIVVMNNGSIPRIIDPQFPQYSAGLSNQPPLFVSADETGTVLVSDIPPSEGGVASSEHLWNALCDNMLPLDNRHAAQVPLMYNIR